MITAQAELRKAFWADHPQFKRSVKASGYRSGGQKLYVEKTQNDYPADTRMAWCDYVEHMNRIGEISDALADRATL